MSRQLGLMEERNADASDAASRPTACYTPLSIDRWSLIGRRSLPRQKEAGWLLYIFQKLKGRFSGTEWSRLC